MAGTREPDTLASPGDASVAGGSEGSWPTWTAGAEQSRDEHRMADAVRALALDAVACAGSGNAAVAMGMADVAAALWSRHLRFDAADPRWPDRDRCDLPRPN